MWGCLESPAILEEIGVITGGNGVCVATYLGYGTTAMRPFLSLRDKDVAVSAWSGLPTQ